ncbi:MAG: hypothetical protein IJU40_01675 [Desulfovibrionaceae bacterium]|nr:hypothetical protein [Desulfovibrionaceae bacterium]
MLKRLLPLILLPFLLSACAGFKVIDLQGYEALTKQMPEELKARQLPVSYEEYQSAETSSSKPYGKILFAQLSPTFMKGQTAQYYLGDTFKDTLQPMRSRVSHLQNGFNLEHVSQSIEVRMLAIVDWNQDGKEEWLVSCKVTPRRGVHIKTWYLLVPPPLNSQEILLGTPCAILDCVGAKCQLIVKPSQEIPRMAKNDAPLTEVKEFRPGEQNVTTPPETPKTNETSLKERSL